MFNNAANVEKGVFRQVGVLVASKQWFTFGPDGLVYPIFMDTSNVKIKVLPKTGETANDIIQKSSAERLANLKEKYAVFKREGGKK